MTIKLSSLLKLSVAGSILLTVGACKATDKGQGALKSESVAALNLSKSETSVFSKYFTTASCDVDELEALGALAGLGMGESGDNGVSFDAREVKDGVVTYRGLTQRVDGSDDVAFSAGTVVFHCPKMSDDSPSFNRLDVTDIFVRDERDDVEFKAETLNIANPTADAARAIVENMTRPNSSAVKDIGFGAVSITGVKVTSSEMNGTLDAISWGETRNETGQGIADLTVEDINLVIQGQQGAGEMTIDFDGMSARNLNIGVKNNTAKGLSPDGVVGSLFDNLNAFQKPYDEVVIEPLKVNSEAFSLNFAGLEGKTTEKGKVITTRANLKPTVMELKPALGDNPAFRQNYEILKSLGMETITFSGSSVSTLDSADDSASVSDGLFVIDDVLRLNFEYEAEGVGEMLQKVQSLQVNGSNANILEVYDTLKLRGFRMTLEDNSIVDKGLTVASQMTGQSEKSLKLMVTGAVFLAASQAKNELEADVYSKSMEAFANFVKKGGTLTLEANPPEPFSFGPLLSGKAEDMDPAALGFSASQAN